MSPQEEETARLAYETFVRESGYDASRWDSVKRWQYLSDAEKRAWSAAAETSIAFRLGRSA